MKKFTIILVALMLIGCGGGGGNSGTNGGAPVAAIAEATSVDQNGATLNGSMNPNGIDASAWFEYGTDSDLLTYTSTSEQTIGPGIIEVPVAQYVSGLAGGTTYYYRVCGRNENGSAQSAIISFTTSQPGAAPAVTTLAATSVGASTATLNGSVIANVLETIAWFEYGTDPDLASYTSTSSQSAGSGLLNQSVKVNLTGLAIGTTYYYRVAASNSSGTTRGDIETFVSGAPFPAVTTLAETSVGANTATLNGNVMANGLETYAWFVYGVEPTLTFPLVTRPTTHQSVGSGTTSQSVNATITGLLLGGTYYYRVVASNGSGTSEGEIFSFTTIAAPSVTTLAATAVGANTATLNGSVIANGLETIAWFEYGTDPEFASSASTSPQPAGSGKTVQPVHEPLTGLNTGIRYYFRVAASNSSGTTRGDIASVTTGTEPGSGEWTATGSTVEQRSSHTATLLQNGKVLFAGGSTLGPSYSSAELYDPATGTFAATGSMAVSRSGYTATLLPDGKVLAAGGTVEYDGLNTQSLSSVELYDPASGTWTRVSPMTSERSGHTATLLQNGKVLVVGGWKGSYGLAELYDPAKGTWETTGSLVLFHGIGRYTATLLSDGRVLIAGGSNIIGPSYSSAELYDPATGTFTATGSMTAERWSHTATLLPNGKVLLAGGMSGVPPAPISSAELYDPATGTWSVTESMAGPRTSHTSTLLTDGRVLVAGGWNGDMVSGSLNSAELYDPTTGTWGNTGLMVEQRGGHTATLLQNGKVLVAGGGDGKGTSSALAELYNP